MNADVRGGQFLLLSKYITEEDLSGQITGINTQFDLNSNFSTGSVRVFVNGLRIQKGAGKDFIEVSPNQIEFNYLLEIGDILLVDYIKN